MASKNPSLKNGTSDLTLEVQSKPIFELHSGPPSAAAPTLRRESMENNNKKGEINQRAKATANNVSCLEEAKKDITQGKSIEATSSDHAFPFN